MGRPKEKHGKGKVVHALRAWTSRRAERVGHFPPCRKLKWDAARQEIVGDSEASKLLSPPLRSPWHL